MMFQKIQRGYTLIEMIVVIAITVLALGVVTAAVLTFYRTNRTTLNQAYAVESARSGIERMTGDIRGIQYAADGAYPIAAIGTSTFTFYADVTGDSVAEKVQYALSGSSLLRTITPSSGNPPVYDSSSSDTTTVSTSVRNGILNIPIFHYFASSSAEILTFPSATPIAYVTTTVIVNENLATSTGDYTLRGVAALRNISSF